MKLSLIWLLCFRVCVGIQYFVTLKDAEAFDNFYANDLKYPEELRVRERIKNTFSISNFRGFTGDFTSSMIKRLMKCPYVSEITPDITIQAFELIRQTPSPRHLARISQRKRLKQDLTYSYDAHATGEGVNAYILDSGVEINHPEFGGRAVQGIDLTQEGPGDSNGHGTHVAGIIGSKTYGVAKDVTLIEVKCLFQDGIGSLSTIIAALEYAVNHRLKSKRPGVANLSLGAPTNQVLNRAIDASVDAGLVVVVASGNSNINACKNSPGSAPKAITVGSIDDTNDRIASFSNWGECVDIFASGTYVQSVDYQNHQTPKELSGTSMSAPIVTGIVANLLSAEVEPSRIKETLFQIATENKIKSMGYFWKRKTPNRIAFNGVISVDPDSESDYDSDFSE